MLPCQEHCSQYCQGCHLDCPYWTSFCKNQESQRQLKAVSELLRGIVRRQDTAISETIPFEVVKADTGRI